MSAPRQTSASDLVVSLQLLGAARRAVLLAKVPTAEFEKVDAMLTAASRRIQRVLMRLEPRRKQLAKGRS